mmetsp:Transcript_18015/g.36949  ORF Transcript_18015/g.36949 Transcript_18015/m.36949 type:complete len:213 (-) Transcript_18015:30-668(-)
MGGFFSGQTALDLLVQAPGRRVAFPCIPKVFRKTKRGVLVGFGIGPRGFEFSLQPKNLGFVPGAFETTILFCVGEFFCEGRFRFLGTFRRRGSLSEPEPDAFDGFLRRGFGGSKIGHGPVEIRLGLVEKGSQLVRFAFESTGPVLQQVVFEPGTIELSRAFLEGILETVRFGPHQFFLGCHVDPFVGLGLQCKERGAGVTGFGPDTLRWCRR